MITMIKVTIVLLVFAAIYQIYSLVSMDIQQRRIIKILQNNGFYRVKPGMFYKINTGIVAVADEEYWNFYTFDNRNAITGFLLQSKHINQEQINHVINALTQGMGESPKNG